MYGGLICALAVLAAAAAVVGVFCAWRAGAAPPPDPTPPSVAAAVAAGEAARAAGAPASAPTSDASAAASAAGAPAPAAGTEKFGGGGARVSADDAWAAAAAAARDLVRAGRESGLDADRGVDGQLRVVGAFAEAAAPGGRLTEPPSRPALRARALEPLRLALARFPIAASAALAAQGVNAPLALSAAGSAGGGGLAPGPLGARPAPPPGWPDTVACRPLLRGAVAGVVEPAAFPARFAAAGLAAPYCRLAAAAKALASPQIV